MGNSTYEACTNLKFVGTDASDAAMAGSIFSEGSLVMVVSFTALIASIAALTTNLASRKKKAASATANGAETVDEES
jgi:hypothetical protein